MTLVLGAPAPALVLESLDGDPFDLAALRGRAVLLAFLRNARCALCNLWVAENARRAPAWRLRGLEVVAVFEAEMQQLRAHLEGRDIPFPILADPDGSAHEAFGSRLDPERVQAVVDSGVAAGALQRAAAAGFPAVHEPGARFARLPSEVLVDAAGRIALVHVADQVSNHLESARIETALRSLRGQ